MSLTTETKQRVAANADERAVGERGVTDTERAEVEWINSADLRAMTPEEIQILAATGC